MGSLSNIEQDCVERAAAEPMLAQVEAWAAINSGSRNLAGLERMADMLVDAFAALPGLLRLERPGAVKAVDVRGQEMAIEYGRRVEDVGPVPQAKHAGRPDRPGRAGRREGHPQDDVVRECVSLAMQSPSGSNNMTMQFVVVRDDGGLSLQAGSG